MKNHIEWSDLQAPVIDALLALSDAIVQVCLSQKKGGFEQVGPHVRHCLDYIRALKSGVEMGVIDYNQRRRGSLVEHNAAAALSEIAVMLAWLRSAELADSPVVVIAEYSSTSQLKGQFKSSLMRELLHVIEHTVHHTAFIVVIATSLGVTLSEHAGVAAATLSFRRNKKAKK